MKIETLTYVFGQAGIRGINEQVKRFRRNRCYVELLNLQRSDVLAAFFEKQCVRFCFSSKKAGKSRGYADVTGFSDETFGIMLEKIMESRPEIIMFHFTVGTELDFIAEHARLTIGKLIKRNIVDCVIELMLLENVALIAYNKDIYDDPGIQPALEKFFAEK
jgi:hypothetical protein